MKQALLWGGLAFVLTLAACGQGLGQGKDKKKANKDDAAKATPDEYKLLSKVNELEGKVGSADAAAGALNLQIDFPHLEQNPNYKPPQGNNNAAQWRSLYQQQAQIMTIANPAQRQQKIVQFMAQVQRLQAQAAKDAAAALNNNPPFKVVHVYKEFELQLADKAVVRKLNFALDYDNEGNIKEYTKEELAKLRGNDPKVPGYAAKLDDLKPGQFIHLYLNPVKADPKAADNEGAGSVVRPTVRMIVILQEPNNPTAPSPGGSKKKN